MGKPKNELQSDLLCGAKAIADALGCKPRRVYHLAERGLMPIWNEPGMRGSWRASVVTIKRDACSLRSAW